MLEESVSAIPSIWASMNSWFTPSVLFVFLNLMIGTIAITSSLATQKQGDQQQQQQEDPQPQPPNLARSPSVLERLKSINLYSYRSTESTTHTQQETESSTHLSFIEPQTLFSDDTSPLLEILEPENLYIEKQEEEEEEEEERSEIFKVQVQDQEERSIDDIYIKLKEQRTKSDTKPASGEIPTKLAKKMKKSASAKSAFLHFEEEEMIEARRPATVKEKKVVEFADVDDDEVDAKADDFINKFKHQLKLQRIDSIVRYKDMVGRGNNGK